MSIQTFMFCTLAVLLAGYVILDGFDLGVGILHLTSRGDDERRVLLGAIGPVWDGNEVWLVTFGGALFAAFPGAYATIFSGFYLPFVLLLVALILRAAAVEFRGKHDGPEWKAFWDAAFCASSLTAAVLLGVAGGNCLQGLPVGADMEFSGRTLDLLKPYPLLAGALAAALLTLHGSLYLLMKTEGGLNARLRGWAARLDAAAAVLLVAAAALTARCAPAAWGHLSAAPAAAGAAAAVAAAALAGIPLALRSGRPGWAFLLSSSGLGALCALFALAMFPNLVLSSLDPGWSLTVHNAASSEKTLRIIRLIALAGMPVVLAYTAFVYRVFRGKVRLEPAGY